MADQTNRRHDAIHLMAPNSSISIKDGQDGQECSKAQRSTRWTETIHPSKQYIHDGQRI